jgi:hypothetical protein
LPLATFFPLGLRSATAGAAAEPLPTRKKRTSSAMLRDCSVIDSAAIAFRKFSLADTIVPSVANSITACDLPIASICPA